MTKKVYLNEIYQERTSQSASQYKTKRQIIEQQQKWNGDIQKYANAVQKKKELNKILKTKDKQVWTSGSWAELDRDRTPQQGVMSAQMGLREKLLSVLVIKVV